MVLSKRVFLITITKICTAINAKAVGLTGGLILNGGRKVGTYCAFNYKAFLY